MVTQGARVEEDDAIATSTIEKKLDEWGWGLFFIWVAIAFIADVGWGLGLLGVGIIILGEQAARVYCGLALDGFWTVLGLMFVVGGGWELMFESEFPLIPVALFMIGVTFIWSAIRGGFAGRHHHFSRGPGRQHHRGVAVD